MSRRSFLSNTTSNPGTSSRRRIILKPAAPPNEKDVPSHTSRLISLNINPGNSSQTMSTVKTLRKWGGFVDRSKAWAEIYLHNAGQLEDDRIRYWNRLQILFDKCEGCELLLCSHVFSFGASFLQANDESDIEESSEELWEENVFRVHSITDIEQKSSIKRLLMALEEDYDLDYAPCIIDIVCLLSLHLSEVQVYAVMRRLWTVSSSKFLRLQRKRKSNSPRRFLSLGYNSATSLHLVFLECVRRLDSRLYDCLLPAVNEVENWFSRWLIPIFPMNKVLVFLDCLLAGDDLKLLYKGVYAALSLSKISLLKAYENRTNEPYSPTAILKQHMSTLPNTLNLFLSKKVPGRKRLMVVEQGLSIGKPILKTPVVHVSRDAFSASQTVLTFDAAARLVKTIPSQYRHAASRVRCIFRSDIGPMGNLKLSDLYAACELEKNCFYILLISSKIPDGPDVLRPRKLSEGQRSDSTSFSHPLIPDDSNYSVFGAFTSTPLTDKKKVAEESGVDEIAYVFRLAPKSSCAVWRNTSKTGEKIVHCKSNSLWIGKISTASKLENPIPSPHKPDSEDFIDATVGPALSLDELLANGHTGYCETFHNEPLCVTQDRPDFALDPQAKKNIIILIHFLSKYSFCLDYDESF